MISEKNELIDPLLETGNVYRLECEICESFSIQITQNREPDLVCIDCGGNCKIM